VIVAVVVVVVVDVVVVVAFDVVVVVEVLAVTRRGNSTIKPCDLLRVGSNDLQYIFFRKSHGLVVDFLSAPALQPQLRHQTQQQQQHRQRR
jgi:hypothetical protein